MKIVFKKQKHFNIFINFRRKYKTNWYILFMCWIHEEVRKFAWFVFSFFFVLILRWRVASVTAFAVVGVISFFWVSIVNAHAEILCYTILIYNTYVIKGKSSIHEQNIFWKWILSCSLFHDILYSIFQQQDMNIRV